MSSTVLLALDGSEKDERGVAGAAALASLANASIHVIRVVAVKYDRLSALTEALVTTTEQEDAHRAIERELETAVEKLRQQIGAKVTCDVVRGNDVGETLLGQIEERGAAFVVMATRAAGVVGRAIHGSVADHLVRESPKPVLLVPPRAEHLGGRQIQFGRVLVPFDGSRVALSAMQHLMALPHAEELELVFIQVIAPERTGGYPMPPGMEGGGTPGTEWTHVSARVAEEQLTALADPLRQQGRTVDIRVVESPHAAEVIIQSVREELVELIAMTTRGAGGLRRLVLGSVAEQVVRDSEIPVLLVTAGAAAPSVE
jgi:nucleotide-binding universal stress UspA family protein